MSIAEQYRRQFAWRPWSEILSALPPLQGATVLDLGCAAGDLAAELCARGARVIGVDMDEELLSVARSRELSEAEFLTGNLQALPPTGKVNGIWSSFAAAYFTDLAPVLRHWRSRLEPGGWIALSEVDDFFGHGPLPEDTRQCLEGYVGDALEKGRYDFFKGRRLVSELESAGLRVERKLNLADAEIAFQGPARPEVRRAWEERLERMHTLESYCGNEYERVRSSFLDCLSKDDHVSSASVRFCLARLP